MPVSRTCTFCGNDIEPGTGKMYVRRDGTVHFFCSGKCQKNLLHLGRQGRKVRWTRRFVRAVREQAPSPRLEPRAEVVEEAPSPEEAPEAEREAVVQAFSELPGIGEATALALWAAGFTSVQLLMEADEDELTQVKGIGAATAKKIRAHLEKASK